MALPLGQHSMDIRLPPCFPAKASSPKVTVPSRVGGSLPVSGICQGRLVHGATRWAQCIRQQWPLGGRKRTRQVWVGAGCLTRSPRREGHHGAERLLCAPYQGGAVHSAASAQGQVARRGLPAPSQQPAPPVHPPLPAPPQGRGRPAPGRCLNPNSGIDSATPTFHAS